MKAFQCFLFEQIMIFSEMVGKKTTFTSPSYEYKAHFMVSNYDFTTFMQLIYKTYFIKNHLKIRYLHHLLFHQCKWKKIGIYKYNENTTMTKFRNKIAEKIDIESRVLSEAFNTE